MNNNPIKNPFEGKPLYYPIEFRIKILDGAIECGIHFPTNDCPTNPEDKEIAKHLEEGIQKLVMDWHVLKRQGQQANMLRSAEDFNSLIKFLEGKTMEVIVKPKE